MEMKPWQEVAQRAQAYRDKSIAEINPPIPAVPEELPQNVTHLPKQLLTPREVEITEMLPEELLPALADGKLTSVEVINAFVRRAGLAQQLVNCVTEIMVPQALERAKYCDEYLAKHGRPIGPLHGLPISVKEHIGMKGLTQNCGFVAWIDEVAKEDAFILTLLHNAGAVFYVRTTEPQLLMHLETASNLYGVTVNPYNRALTSGGSSGGEGALLGLRGSCLGIGTDIGGSIRSPAANNGVWGFRPSSYRLPNSGAHAPGLGEEQIVPVIGPMSTSFAGLNVFMKTIIDQKPWLNEPSMVPLKWNTAESHLVERFGQRKLKVGIMWHDGVVKPHPPIMRALTEMAAKLKKTPGIEVVDWAPHKHEESWDIISSLYFCASAKEDMDIMEAGGEPILPLSKFILLEQSGVPQEEDIASTIWKKTIRREAFKTEYAAHWNATGAADGHPVDVILCPVGPGAAPPLDHSRYWAYTSTWNLLDYPAMVFPYSQVDQEKDKADEGYVPMNDQDDWNHKLYSPERYADAPISLQLVGRRCEDEKVFEAMQFIRIATGV
ncbi:hypothetical protein OHC33_006318 [Knufia fluminis]|uniref:amidase n=1 Tax=Knufia fluminis TaxID=191047 RepID=A0AAN8ESN6_9EURO|nr:hypothetical protein OHC33_006318 [Knufia fluminis]